MGMKEIAGVFIREECFLPRPQEFSPSPRQPSAGRGLGRGASTGLQTWAAVAFRQGGLLSPTLSSKRGEGGPVVGWWQCQDALLKRGGGGGGRETENREREKGNVKRET